MATAKRVYVYRNLKHGRHSPSLYSIMFRGKVVRRTRAVMLNRAKFVIHPAGRAKVLQTGRKNVHAFVVGEIVGSSMGTDRFGKLPRKLTYRPMNAPFFTDQEGFRVDGADAVILNKHGLTAAYTYRESKF